MTDMYKAPLPADAPNAYPGTGYPPQQQQPSNPAYNEAPPPYSQTTQTHIYQHTSTSPHTLPAPPIPINNNHVTSIAPAQVSAMAMSYIPGAPEGSQRVVETVPLSRKKTLTVVTDLATGQKYTVREKTSLSGRRSKAVIREVGVSGPKTVLKQTPRKTVVKQKF